MQSLNSDSVSFLSTLTATKAFYEFTQGWSDQDVQAKILDVYNGASLTNYTEVDQLSVMKCVSRS